MTPDQLRELADALWNLMARFTYESDRTPLRDASAFLRQCAEQRSVTYKHTEPDGSVAYFGADEAPCEKCVPLYAAPVPPQRELLSDAQIASACLRYRHDFGLLDKYERDCIVNEARRWADAFGIGGSDAE